MTQISQIDRGNLDKVAVDNGFVIPQLDQDGWMSWEAHVPASLRFTLDGDTRVAAVKHAGGACEFQNRRTTWIGKPAAGLPDLMQPIASHGWGYDPCTPATSPPRRRLGACKISEKSNERP
jgi:hypothetical protein